MLRFIFIIVVFAFLILFTVTIALAVNHTHKRKHYVECTGTIERFWKRRRPGQDAGKASISPIVSYVVNGTRYELIGDYWSGDMQVGQEITLLYDAADPAKATVKKGLYLAPFITGILAAFSLFALVVLIVLKFEGFLAF